MLNIIQKLAKKKQFYIKAEGISMMPILQSNDIVNFRKTTFSQVKVNDLILAKKNKNYLIHRVIYKNNRYLIIKGDNNAASDGKIHPKNVLSKVISIKRKGVVFLQDNIYLLQSTLYFQEIVKIKKVLEKEKVDFVFLKGLLLHLYYKKEHPRRYYSDCDLLIHKNHHQKLEKALFGLGYKKRFFNNINKRIKHKEISYYKLIQGLPVIFDVHFELAFIMMHLGKPDPLYFQKHINEMTEEFMKEKKIISVMGEKFPILSEENLVIYLALHFFHHKFKGIARLDFLNEVVKKITFNRIKSIKEKVNRYDLNNFIYTSFRLLNKYYCSDFSRKLLNCIQPKREQAEYVKKTALEIDVFKEERLELATIKRLYYLFSISPYPFIKKLGIFLNPYIYRLFFTNLIDKVKK